MPSALRRVCVGGMRGRVSMSAFGIGVTCMYVLIRMWGGERLPKGGWWSVPGGVFQNEVPTPFGPAFGPALGPSENLCCAC